MLTLAQLLGQMVIAELRQKLRAITRGNLPHCAGQRTVL
jgi:hypothetical protein